MKMKQVSMAILMAIVSLTGTSYAQQNATAAPKTYSGGKNMLKVNLPGLFARSYQFQYERVLSRKVSLAISYRTMPMGALPFKNSLLDLVADDQDAVNTFENMEMASTAITPEFRFYLSKKGYGRGFYLAPFYRYAKIEGRGVQVDYTLPNNTVETISLSGDAKGNAAGLLLGAQWALGKSICLDWWIIGPQYGTGKANLDGRTRRPLNALEQDALRSELQELDFPLVDEQITVTSTGASIKMDGPWAGVRAGLSLGVKF